MRAIYSVRGEESMRKQGSRFQDECKEGRRGGEERRPYCWNEGAAWYVRG